MSGAIPRKRRGVCGARGRRRPAPGPTERARGARRKDEGPTGPVSAPVRGSLTAPTARQNSAARVPETPRGDNFQRPIRGRVGSSRRSGTWRDRPDRGATKRAATRGGGRPRAPRCQSLIISLNETPSFAYRYDDITDAQRCARAKQAHANDWRSFHELSPWSAGADHLVSRDA